MNANSLTDFSVATAAATLLGALTMIILSTFVREFFLKPTIALRKTIADIEYTLVFRGNVIANGGPLNDQDLRREVSESLRHLSASLRTQRMANLCYSFAVWFRLVPRAQKLKIAAKELIGLSNYTASERESERRLQSLDRLRNILKPFVSDF